MNERIDKQIDGRMMVDLVAATMLRSCFLEGSHKVYTHFLSDLRVNITNLTVSQLSEETAVTG